LKTLLLMRHAKSSWDNPALADYERPLNRRGLRDAPRMGRWLAAQSLVPDLVVTSSAERARQTAQIVVDAMGASIEIREFDSLYHASRETWMGCIVEFADSDSVVLCVGHNPGMELLVSTCAGAGASMPTAAVARVISQIEHWADWTAAGADVVDLWRPKEMGWDPVDDAD